jgi:hypothetical protein
MRKSAWVQVSRKKKIPLEEEIYWERISNILPTRGVEDLHATQEIAKQEVRVSINNTSRGSYKSVRGILRGWSGAMITARRKGK